MKQVKILWIKGELKGMTSDVDPDRAEAEVKAKMAEYVKPEKADK